MVLKVVLYANVERIAGIDCSLEKMLEEMEIIDEQTLPLYEEELEQYDIAYTAKEKDEHYNQIPFEFDESEYRTY